MVHGLFITLAKDVKFSQICTASHPVCLFLGKPRYLASAETEMVADFLAALDEKALKTAPLVWQDLKNREIFFLQEKALVVC